MKIPMYLAMTAAEFESADTLPENTAWMACHFSCYGTGLSNLPHRLPENAMIIVNDRTPVMGHDPGCILTQLLEIYEVQKPKYFLLDFQRKDEPLTAEITNLLTKELPCPAAATPWYAKTLDCPVFLSPPPLHTPLKDYLAPWKGREIWLEAAIMQQTVTVTETGNCVSPVSFSKLAEPIFTDTNLHCHYHIEQKEDAVVFHLQRDSALLSEFTDEAQTLGVTMGVGLYQQLGR